MSRVSSEMKSLCEDIVKTYEERIKATHALKEEAGSVREGARKFLGECKKLHKEMAKDLRKGLLEHREELIENINSLREDFRKKEKEIRSDLTEASKIWSKMNETLKAKKAKSLSAGREKGR